MSRPHAKTPCVWTAPELQPTLEACEGCGAMVIKRIAGWDDVGITENTKTIPKVRRVPVYREQNPPLNPVTGSVHTCDTGLALQAIAQSTRWNEVQRCTPHTRSRMREGEA
jgi:hypothetical protein